MIDLAGGHSGLSQKLTKGNTKPRHSGLDPESRFVHLIKIL